MPHISSSKDRMNVNPTTLFDDMPISVTQKIVFAICFVLNMFDGMDVVIVSYSASGIMADLGLRYGQMGLVFSAGLIGMALGCLVLGFYADKIGRRKLILGGLALIAMGVFLGGQSQNIQQLAAMIPLCLLLLPESLSFLAGKDKAVAVKKINTILGKMHHPLIGSIASAFYQTHTAINVTDLLKSRFRIISIGLWGGLFFTFMTMYYLLSWIPKIAIDSGLSSDKAIIAGPFLGGYLLAMDLKLVVNFTIFGAIMLIAAVIIYPLRYYVDEDMFGHAATPKPDTPD